MWFVLLSIALSVVLTGGLYFRRRFLGALAKLGVGPVRVRRAGWAVLWLLFGYPILVFVFVFGALALGSDSFSLAPGGILTWILVLPFWLSVLIMLQSVPFLLFFDLASLALRKRMETGRPKAIACLLIVAIFAIYTPARILLERSSLRVRHYQVGHSVGQSGYTPFRIVFLGDLQRDGMTGAARTQEVVDIANEQDADVILVGGDWINTGAHYIEAAAEAGGAMRSRLGTFSVEGDHEHFAYRDQERSVREIQAALARSGVQMIDNELRWFEHGDKRIAVLFLSYNYIYRTPEGELKALLAKAEGADYSILITHQFDSSLASIVRDSVDLVLAAHTHGGQVNPFLGVAHVPLARVETEFVEGRFELSARTTLIVTAGIGFSLAPFRYAAPASMEVIELWP